MKELEKILNGEKATKAVEIPKHKDAERKAIILILNNIARELSIQNQMWGVIAAEFIKMNDNPPVESLINRIKRWIFGKKSE